MPPTKSNHLARIELERLEHFAVNDNDEGDEFDNDDELIRESPEEIVQSVRKFVAVKKLLTTAELGTS